MSRILDASLLCCHASSFSCFNGICFEIKIEQHEEKNQQSPCKQMSQSQRERQRYVGVEKRTHDTRFSLTSTLATTSPTTPILDIRLERSHYYYYYYLPATIFWMKHSFYFYGTRSRKLQKCFTQVQHVRR